MKIEAKLAYQQVYLKQSKLEMYINILKLLSTQKSLKLPFGNKSNFKCTILEEYLLAIDFLDKQGLIKITRKNTHSCSITQRGIRILNYFGSVNKLPLIDDIENET